ncbi:MAG: hypothetical protein ACE5KT_00340 [Methanosarcinales archaeon]
MSEFFVWQGPKDNMLLWNTSMRWRYVPAKSTKTGDHKPAVMVSVSRIIKPENEIDKYAISKLPKTVQREIFEKYQTETLRKAPLTLKDRFSNVILKSYDRIGSKIFKTLGVKIEKKKGNIEIYEFLKFRNVDEYLGLLYGFAMGLGILGYMNRLKPKELLELRKKIELQFGKYLMLGYERAKKNRWTA